MFIQRIETKNHANQIYFVFVIKKIMRNIDVRTVVNRHKLYCPHSLHSFTSSIISVLHRIRMVVPKFKIICLSKGSCNFQQSTRLWSLNWFSLQNEQNKWWWQIKNSTRAQRTWKNAFIFPKIKFDAWYHSIYANS